MLTVARVAAVDTRPDDLRLSHSVVAHPVAPRPAVATRRLPGGVELRILAASHQVVVTDPDGTEWVETVACGTGEGEWVRDGLTVVGARAATAVEVRRLDGPAFAAEVETWRRWGRGSDTTLVVEFPGRDAVTGLARVPVGWASLHSYPSAGGGGTVVLTRTAILSAGSAFGPGLGPLGPGTDALGTDALGTDALGTDALGTGGLGAGGLGDTEDGGTGGRSIGAPA